MYLSSIIVSPNPPCLMLVAPLGLAPDLLTIFRPMMNTQAYSYYTVVSIAKIKRFKGKLGVSYKLLTFVLKNILGSLLC